MVKLLVIDISLMRNITNINLTALLLLIILYHLELLGHWYPSYLFNYKNEYLTQYIVEYFQGNTSKVVQAIEDSSNNIIVNQNQNTQDVIANQNQNTQDVIENQNQIKDDILNSDIDDSSISINTDGLSSTEDYGVNDFFTRLLEISQGGLTTRSNSSLDFTIPFINADVHIPSTVISYNLTKYFGATGELIILLVRTLWTVYFGSYYVIFAKRMFDWLSTGKIVEKGGHSFLEFLDAHNTILDSYMM